MRLGRAEQLTTFQMGVFGFLMGPRCFDSQKTPATHPTHRVGFGGIEVQLIRLVPHFFFLKALRKVGGFSRLRRVK